MSIDEVRGQKWRMKGMEIKEFLISKPNDTTRNQILLPLIFEFIPDLCSSMISWAEHKPNAEVDTKEKLNFFSCLLF